MSSFIYNDLIDQARELLKDDAQRRWTDADLMTRYVPRVLTQLYADRPDAFLGNYSFDRTPTLAADCAFDDVVANAFVEGLVAAVQGSSDEASSEALASKADARSQRARKS